MRNVLTGGIQQREHRHSAARVRMPLEVELERLEPADDVLRRIGSIDADDQLLAGDLLQAALPLAHFLAVGKLLELGRVDRDRTGGDERPPAVVLDRAEVVVDLRAEDAGHREEEVLAPAVGVEADHIVREQPVVDRNPDRLRQDRPVVRPWPGNVHEVRQQGVRPGAADEPRRKVEVVVVEPDRGVGLCGRGPRERLLRRTRSPSRSFRPRVVQALDR